MNQLLVYTQTGILCLVYISITIICKFLYQYPIFFKSFFSIYYQRICGSHDTKIKIWQFNPNYKEKFEKPENELTQEDVVSFLRLVEHHHSAITSLTYDGINCIISSNVEGFLIFIRIFINYFKSLLINEN